MFFKPGSAVRGCAPVAAAFFAIITSASAQAPSQAQRDAIKTQCRSDYIAHCSSVPPGGEASLECLQKNMSSLSSSCAGAVRAGAMPAAAPKAADTAPAAKPRTDAAPPASKPAAAPKAAAAAAGQPSSAQISAIRSACSSDYPKVCKGVPTGGAPALQCLETNKAKLSPACQTAVNAAGGGSSTVGAGPATGAATAAVATPRPIVLRPPAAARGAVRAAIGLQRRRQIALRQRRAGRRSHRAVPRQQWRIAVAGMQGRSHAFRPALSLAQRTSLAAEGEDQLNKTKRQHDVAD